MLAGAVVGWEESERVGWVVESRHEVARGEGSEGIGFAARLVG